MSSPGTDDLFAKIIGYSAGAITAIVWIKKYAPQEVHDKEYERFLIVEGTCNIVVGDEVNQLVPGDYFAIPLFENHFVEVTSSIPCKVILQRVAAWYSAPDLYGLGFIKNLLALYFHSLYQNKYYDG